MIFRLNKRTILLLCAVLAACDLTICLLFSGKTETLASLPVSERIIVVDAGHGGMDGGAESASGIKEKDINLKIAKYLKSYLEQGGAKVVMTRESDISLHENDNAAIRSRKRQDLLKRREIANTSGADMLLSIHLNQFEQSKYKGAQVFYETASPKSKLLATSIQSSMRENLDKTNTRTEMKIASNKLQFQDLNLPAVIIECGFLSNPEEALMLNTPEYQEKIALSIYLGVLSYYNQ